MTKVGWRDFIVWQCSLRQRNFRMFQGKPSEGIICKIYDKKNNKDIKNYSISEIITDLKSFTRKFNSQVLIRSIPKNKKILNIICNKREVFVIETPYINFKERFHGAGDQSTALYAHYICKKNTTREILENVTNDIYEILLKNKIRSKKRKKRFKAMSLNNL